MSTQALTWSGRSEKTGQPPLSLLDTSQSCRLGRRFAPQPHSTRPSPPGHTALVRCDPEAAPQLWEQGPRL